MLGDTLIERLFHLLITGDGRRARALIERTLAAGASADEIIIETFRPIVTMIESLGRADQLSDRARDHATVLLQNLLDDARAGQLQTTVCIEDACLIESGLTPPLDGPAYRTLTTGDYGRVPARHAPGTASPFVNLSYRDGVLTARPVGPNIGPRQAPIVREEIDRALDLVCHGLRAIVIDLGDVETMSSLALSVCVELRSRAKFLGARFELAHVGEHLARVFELVDPAALHRVASGVAA